MYTHILPEHCASLAVYAAQGETKEFTVTANTAWEVVSWPSWCQQPSPAQGTTGSAVIAVTALENYMEQRDSVVTLRIPSGEKYYISLTQYGAVLYRVEIPAFSSTRAFNVYDGEQKVAEVCKEYIKGYSETQPAVVLYGAPAGVRANTGFLADNCGQVVWDPAQAANAAGFCTYTAPVSSQSYTVLYYKPSTGEISPVELPNGTLKNTTNAAVTFTDWEGTVYNIVKVGLTYWTGSNLRALTYAGGTTIPTNLATTAWTSTTSGACCVYGNPDAGAAKTGSDINFTTYGVLYNG